jgi:hypothetical protein
MSTFRRKSTGYVRNGLATNVPRLETGNSTEIWRATLLRSVHNAEPGLCVVELPYDV